MFAAPSEMAILEKTTADNKIKEAWLEELQYPIADDDFNVIICAMEWPKRVRVVIQVHQKRIQDVYDIYEAALKKKCIGFATILEELVHSTCNRHSCFQIFQACF
jgi:hypothetical protein